MIFKMTDFVGLFLFKLLMTNYVQDCFLHPSRKPNATIKHVLITTIKSNQQKHQIIYSTLSELVCIFQCLQGL